MRTIKIETKLAAIHESHLPMLSPCKEVVLRCSALGATFHPVTVNDCTNVKIVDANLYPRCATCVWWEEMDSEARSSIYPEVRDFVVGTCQHPRLRGPNVEVGFTSPEGAEMVEGEMFPGWFFNTAEDFGCVLHHAVTPQSPPYDKRKALDARRKMWAKDGG